MERLPNQTDHIQEDATTVEQFGEASPADLGLKERHLNERQQRVLRCLRCLENPETGEVIGTQQIEDCAKLTKKQKELALWHLVQKGIVSTREVEPDEAPFQEPRTQRAYSVTEKGEKAFSDNNTPCPYGRDKYPQSDNPYIGAQSTRKEILDCLRCLSAQGRQPVAENIALCRDWDIQTVRASLRRQEERGILQSQPAATKMLFPPKANVQRAFVATERTAQYLQPQKLADCTILQKEVDQVLASRTPNQLRALSCIACQFNQMQTEKKGAVTLPATVQCTEINEIELFRFFALLVENNFLTDMTVGKKFRRYLMPTKLGELLLSSIEAPTCASNPEFDHEMFEKRADLTRDRVMRCIDCITQKQQLRGFTNQAATAAMIARCLPLSPDVATTYCQDLAADKRVSVVHESERTSYKTVQAKDTRPMPTGCGYIPPAELKGFSPLRLDASKLISGVALGKRSTQLRAVPILTFYEEDVLKRIIQTGQDTTEVEMAVQTLIIHNLRLAISVLRPFRENIDRPSNEDIRATALLTLSKAARRATYDRGAFSTYVTVAIRRAVTESIAEHRGIPPYSFGILGHMAKLKIDHLRATGSRLSDDELFTKAMVSYSRKSILHALEFERYRRAEISMDDALPGMPDSTLVARDSIRKFEAGYRAVEQESILDDMSASLDEVEQAMFDAMLEGKKQLPDIGRLAGLSQHDLSKRKSYLLRKLSHPSSGVLSVIEPSMFAWQTEAMCHTLRRLDFGKGLRPAKKEVAKVCGSCSVSSKCAELRSNLSPKPPGVWGGTWHAF